MCSVSFALSRDVPDRPLLDVEEPNVARMTLDELTARFDLVSHQIADSTLGFRCVIDIDLQQCPGCWLHRGFPELVGVHFSKTLVPLDVELVGVVVFGKGARQGLFIVDVSFHLRGTGVLLLETVMGG